MKKNDQILLERAYESILTEETIKVPIRSKEKRQKTYGFSLSP